VTQIKICVDEDAMDGGLVAPLRSRGVQVLTVLDTKSTGRFDEDQLEFATEGGFVLYTCNIADFYQIHMRWLANGQEHGGIILAPQQRFSVGEQLRRILRLRSEKTAAAMRNQVEFLSNWG
jgi:hypothetical protein